MTHRVTRKVPVEDLEEAWAAAGEWVVVWAVVEDFIPDGDLAIRARSLEVSGLMLR